MGGACAVGSNSGKELTAGGRISGQGRKRGGHKEKEKKRGRETSKMGGLRNCISGVGVLNVT